MGGIETGGANEQNSARKRQWLEGVKVSPVSQHEENLLQGVVLVLIVMVIVSIIAEQRVSGYLPEPCLGVPGDRASPRPPKGLHLC